MSCLKVCKFYLTIILTKPFPAQSWENAKFRMAICVYERNTRSLGRFIPTYKHAKKKYMNFPKIACAWFANSVTKSAKGGLTADILTAWLWAWYYIMLKMTMNNFWVGSLGLTRNTNRKRRRSAISRFSLRLTFVAANRRREWRCDGEESRIEAPVYVGTIDTIYLRLYLVNSQR